MTEQVKGDKTMTNHKTGTREEWLAARHDVMFWAVSRAPLARREQRPAPVAHPSIAFVLWSSAVVNLLPSVEISFCIDIPEREGQFDAGQKHRLPKEPRHKSWRCPPDRSSVFLGSTDSVTQQFIRVLRGAEPLRSQTTVSTKRPWFAEGAGKQLTRTIITQDALRLCIPFNLPPHQKRNETQVPGDG